MNVDDAFRKFDDISYVHEWAKLYNEYFIRRNNVVTSFLNSSNVQLKVEMMRVFIKK